MCAPHPLPPPLGEMGRRKATRRGLLTTAPIVIVCRGRCPHRPAQRTPCDFVGRGAPTLPPFYLRIPCYLVGVDAHIDPRLSECYRMLTAACPPRGLPLGVNAAPYRVYRNALGLIVGADTPRARLSPAGRDVAARRQRGGRVLAPFHFAGVSSARKKALLTNSGKYDIILRGQIRQKKCLCGSAGRAAHS